MFRIHLSKLKFPKFSFKPTRLAFLPLIKPIYNDSFKNAGNSMSIDKSIDKAKIGVLNAPLSERKKMYNELTIGSITGLFLGVIIGKFSSLIITLTLSCYLLLQFLESRNLIRIPWNYVFKFNRQDFDLKSLVLENFNFKLSFVSSFLIACYNI